MKIYSNTGGFVEIGHARAKRLVATGNWYTEDPTRRASEGVNDETEGNNTSETVEPVTEDDSPVEEVPEAAPAISQERPDVSTVRAWAKENNIEVSAKGRVSAEVYEKYAEAHAN